MDTTSDGTTTSVPTVIHTKTSNRDKNRNSRITVKNSQTGPGSSSAASLPSSRVKAPSTRDDDDNHLHQDTTTMATNMATTTTTGTRSAASSMATSSHEVVVDDEGGNGGMGNHGPFNLATLDDVVVMPDPDGAAVVAYTGRIGRGARSVRTQSPLAKPVAVVQTTTVRPSTSSRTSVPRGGAGKFRLFGRRSGKATTGNRKNNGNGKSDKNSGSNSTTATKATTETVVEWRPVTKTVDPMSKMAWVSYYEVRLLPDILPSVTATVPVTEGDTGKEETAANVTDQDDPVECISVGLSLASFDATSFLPGWQTGSYGYHSDDGKAFCDQQASAYGPSFGPGDVIGCGIDWQERRVFYTRNGKFLGHHSALAESPEAGNKPRNWYPTVGLDSHTPVRINVDGPFLCNLEMVLAGKKERHEEAQSEKADAIPTTAVVVAEEGREKTTDEAQQESASAETETKRGGILVVSKNMSAVDKDDVEDVAGTSTAKLSWWMATTTAALVVAATAGYVLTRGRATK